MTILMATDWAQVNIFESISGPLIPDDTALSNMRQLTLDNQFCPKMILIHKTAHIPSSIS